jgi:hypothetical protein
MDIKRRFGGPNEPEVRSPLPAVCLHSNRLIVFFHPLDYLMSFKPNVVLEFPVNRHHSSACVAVDSLNRDSQERGYFLRRHYLNGIIRTSWAFGVGIRVHRKPSITSIRLCAAFRCLI